MVLSVLIISKPGEVNDSGARKPEVCVFEPLTLSLNFIINEIKHRDAGGSGINPSALWSTSWLLLWLP